MKITYTKVKQHHYKLFHFYKYRHWLPGVIDCYIGQTLTDKLVERLIC